MRDLVGGEIVDDKGGRHDDAPREAEIAVPGTGSPAAAGILHGDGLHGFAYTPLMDLNRRLKIAARLLFQEGGDPPAGMFRKAAAERDRPAPGDTRPRDAPPAARMLRTTEA